MTATGDIPAPAASHAALAGHVHLGGFALSVPGAGHVAAGKTLQDASDCRIEAERTAIVAVADGHGGAKYCRSAEGSKCAVDAALDCLSDFLQQSGQCATLKTASDRHIVKQLRQLEGAIIHAWRSKINEHFAAHDLTDDEARTVLHFKESVRESDKYTLYGTTLLYACVVPDFWFASQIGDGHISLAGSAGNITSPVPDDERLMFGMTTSLCSAEAANDFRRAYGKTTPKGLVLVTDGVYDSYSRLTYPHFVKSILQHYAEAPENTQKEMLQWLPQLSERGSRDDMSVGCVCVTTMAAQDHTDGN